MLPLGPCASRGRDWRLLIHRSRNPDGLPRKKEPRRSRIAIFLWSLGWLVLPSVVPSPAYAQTKCVAADFGCAPTGTCTITGSHEIGSGCHLDWGTQNIAVRGTLRAENLGDSFTITAGQVYLEGGKLLSTGDNETPGGDITIRASGRFWMAGSATRVETGANAGGGSVDIIANDFLIAGSGQINTDGGQLVGCGNAGDVNLSATGGQILLGGKATTVSASTGAYDCDGGLVTLDATKLNLQAGIDASGGAPNGITLLATTGEIYLGPSAVLDARGRGVDEDFGNNGGDIDLLAINGPIDLQGKMNSDGSGGDGSGGDIQLDSHGNMTIAGGVDVAGVGTFASGGVLEITTSGDLNVSASIDASGGPQGDGGTIDAIVQGNILIESSSTLTTLGGVFGGGFLDLRSRADVTVDGDLIGRGGTSGDGGFVDLRGCRISISSTLDVEPGAVGSAGAISLVGGVITLTRTARLEAEPCLVDSCNSLTLRSGAPSIEPGAVVEPAAIITLDPSMTPCCGNGVVDDGITSSVDVGEQCDDRNILYCDGCTPSCEIESIPACPTDGNECTRDQCSPTRGCDYEPLTGLACDDEPGGNVCTTDICKNGVCTHSPKTCDDGIGCTVDSCDPTLGCQTSNSDALCNDGEECTSDFCDPASGDPTTGCVLRSLPDGTTCDDGSVCTTNDRCQGGECITQGPPIECDDGDECTLNDCDPTLGCLNSEDPAACGNCLDGEGAPLEAGTRCVDGNRCTVGDACDGAGSCLSGEFCPEDGDPCTKQVCAFGVCAYTDVLCPGTGSCVHGEPCSDGSACTTGLCNNGTCENTPKPCNDGDECTGLESCSPVFGCRQFSQPPTGDEACDGYVTSAFTCYRTRRSSGTPPFVPVLGLTVEDRFWTRDVDVARPVGLCLPTNFAGSDPAAVSYEDWLVAYRVNSSAGAPPFSRRVNIEVVNALGTTWVDAKRPDSGMAPTAGDLVSPTTAPTPPDPDYYSCYRVGKSEQTPRFRPIRGLAIEDALGALSIDVKRPTRLCSPASVNGINPAASEHATHLLCYQVRTSKLTPEFERVRAIHTTNMIGTGQMDAARISEVCLPSTVTLAAP